jgi:hypothetical protein
MAITIYAGGDQAITDQIEIPYQDVIPTLEIHQGLDYRKRQVGKPAHHGDLSRSHHPLSRTLAGAAAGPG